MMRHSAPAITSILWVIPFSYNHEYFIENSSPFLLFLILNMTFFSCLFWSDPIKNRNTLIHTIDAACARITILAFIVYNVAFQFQNISFFISMGIMFVFFYASNFYSEKEWCCDNHIYSHLIAHIFALFGIHFTLTYYLI